MLTVVCTRAATLTAVLLFPLAIGIGGCATPTQIPIADWHDAVVAVREQSVTTFRGVNDLVRETQVKRAGDLPKLAESDFQPGLDAQSLATWNRALDSLAAYSAALTTLLGPELPAGVGESTQRLGESIASSAKSDAFTTLPGLGSALNKLGTKLASVAAEENARTIMAQTNGAVNDVLNQMANMISDDSDGKATGVFHSVHANWTLRADEVRTVEFLAASTPAEKQRIAARYATMLEQRDAADSALLGLRLSLLELAVAHSRAAAGGPMDTSALIGSVREQTAFFKALLTDLKPAKT